MSPSMPDMCRDDPRRPSRNLKLVIYENVLNLNVRSSSYTDPSAEGGTQKGSECLITNPAQIIG